MFMLLRCLLSSFFFNDPATAEIYTLSLHDALPISTAPHRARSIRLPTAPPKISPSESCPSQPEAGSIRDRKSTRLNSSHPSISYAVFCLKKKTTQHGVARQQLHSLLDCRRFAMRSG